MTKIQTAIKEIMAKSDTSFYIYDEATINAQVNRLKTDLPDYEFIYSIKTNPFAPVVKTVLAGGLGLDAASLAEVMMGVENGLTKDQILYSAPGKTERDIKGAMEHSIIIADSMNELMLIDRVAAQAGKKLEIGVRINPDFTMDSSDKGSSGKFGIDEEILFSHAAMLTHLKNVTVVGIHVHSRSQELSADVLTKYYQNMFALAQKCIDKLGMRMDFINLGGGIGVAYSTAKDSDLDTAALGNKSGSLAKELKAKLPGTRIIIETGRYVVCTAGFYATSVVDVKESRGSKYVMVQNTLNGFIRPSLAMLIAAYLPEGATAKANEPLFTTMDAFDFELIPCECKNAAPHAAKADTEGEEVVSIVGNLCTGADIMAKNITFPKAKVGDIITVSKAGSYAHVLSPVQFSSQLAPAQILLKENGETVIG